ncbi:MAG TPA: FAD-dependent oxidoreductase [Pyrinomonadaceae bacterium]|nr:FAD-dependent oxidoreductase [Pyrinomonadaceae bacterium]
MTKRAEIVIIGGGVVGASVAFHLAERGVRDVLILERESEQGRGSTGAATGGVRAQFETDINIKMSLYSIDFLKNWEHACEYDPKGYLFFATTDGQFDYLKRNVEKQRSLGVEDVEIVDPAQIAKIVPGLNCADITGGSFGKHDGFINPLAVMRGFTEGAVRGGVKIEFGVEVLGLRVEGGKIVGVETNGGLIECDAVVVCTGARAAEIAVSAGIDLPVSPQRRQIVWARTRESLPRNLPMVIDIGTGFHFRPAKDFRADPVAIAPGSDEVLFAYPDPDEPSSVQTNFEESFIDKVYERAKLRADFLFGSAVVRDRCRAGLYENTPDHHAILGRCEVSGLYFANGFSGHGVMHSPATGRALAEIILDGHASFLDVSCLSLDRFAKGELLHETAFI